MVAILRAVAFPWAIARTWGDLPALLGENPVLVNSIILCMALLLAASLLWIRHCRREARRLKVFMDPLSGFEEPA